MADESRITDDQYIAQWRAMIQTFKDLIKDNPPVSKVKDDLLELKEEAVNTFLLTSAQKRGITERCDNYINGTYGKNLSVLPKT